MPLFKKILLKSKDFSFHSPQERVNLEKMETGADFSSWTPYQGVPSKNSTAFDFLPF